MGTRRYGISVRVFKSIRNVELNARRESSYVQITMYYFLYHIGTMALYRQEKST